ncbi:MAG: hypothetical protein KDB00_26360 [Planctomycetales bacterium]|nr:hypothetical protein [Planctomycetales bacterium]
MIRSNTLFQAVSAFAFLVLAACAGTLWARMPEPDLSARHDRLYRKLCELNGNWTSDTPNFEILGDSDFVDDEVSLIQAHLKLVINQLRSADVAHLNESQLAQRMEHLQTLQAYMREGNFPQNIFVPGRRPVFIDPWGTHCAEGHLIATSGHAKLADTINREHQLDLLRDIKTGGLSQWQQASGLSIDELALIQPSYRSTTLKYPAEIEELILGNSESIVADIESGELSVDARCGGISRRR